MIPARQVLDWLGPGDRRDAALALGVMTALGLWRYSPAEALPFGLLGASALAILRIDGRHHLIPDLLVLAIAASGLWHALVAGAVLTPVLITAGAVLVVLALLRGAAARALGQTALGAGDVKLMAASAFWLDPAQMPSFILAAALSGLAESLLLKRRKLAFGRHLAPWLCLFALWGPGFSL
jgi:leader peptidase (prepilin peptidase)/N-methyltransferase